MAIPFDDSTGALVHPQWRDEFLRFVETGNASAAFMDYLDANEGCQRAVDSIIDQQARSLQDMLRPLRRSSAYERLVFSNLLSPQLEKSATNHSGSSTGRTP